MIFVSQTVVVTKVTNPSGDLIYHLKWLLTNIVLMVLHMYSTFTVICGQMQSYPKHEYLGLSEEEFDPIIPSKDDGINFLLLLPMPSVTVQSAPALTTQSHPWHY